MAQWLSDIDHHRKSFIRLQAGSTTFIQYQLATDERHYTESQPLLKCFPVIYHLRHQDIKKKPTRVVFIQINEKKTFRSPSHLDDWCLP